MAGGGVGTAAAAAGGAVALSFFDLTHYDGEEDGQHRQPDECCGEIHRTAPPFTPLDRMEETPFRV